MGSTQRRVTRDRSAYRTSFTAADLVAMNTRITISILQGQHNSIQILAINLRPDLNTHKLPSLALGTVK